MSPRRTSTAPSRASSPDSDVEIIDTSATSPATSVGADDKAAKTEQAMTDAPAKEERPKEEKKEEKPAAVLKAIKDMMRKTQIYLDRIEESRREHQAEDDESDLEIVEDASSSKRKRKGGKKTPPRKKAKKSNAPPLELPQSKLVSGGTMKDYQLDGTNWLVQRYIHAMHGAILADEMGTGKTLQSIGFIAFIHEHIHKAAKPESDKASIVIMPKPVLHNWKAEFSKFAPSIPVLVYEGLPEERSELRRRHLGLKGLHNAPPAPRRTPYPVVLMSYSIAIRDSDYLKALPLDAVICDEAHKAKNLKGKTLNELQKLKSEFRLLLTGTPLQNNLTELYALLFFILPHIFADQQLFENQFDFSSITNTDGSRLTADEEVQLLVVQLQAILKPFMLRRCKKDVVKDLPLKKEYVLTAPQTKRQQELMEAAVKGELRQFLADEAEQRRSATSTPQPEKGKRKGRSREVDMLDLTADDSDASEGRTRRTRAARARRSYVEAQDAADDDVFEDQVLARARKEERAAEEMRLAKMAAKPVANIRHTQAKFSSAMTNLRQIANHPLLKLDDRSEGSNPEDIVNLSGKMMLLDRLLPELFKRKHKVIIFSQFTSMLDLLDEYFEHRGWNWYRIDGRGENQVNQDDIKEFNETPCTEEGVNVFLLSTRAGGVGLNLVGADTVILFDSDWNPQNDLQAMDRAHRIGQKKPVLVFRLATANTVEQTILASATRKRKLERVVLGNDTLSGDASDILDKAKGTKGTKGGRKAQSTKAQAMQQLAEQFALAEGEKVTLAGAGAEILSDEQLEALLDRSDDAMKSATGSGTDKGKAQAAFEVVETIEESEVQQSSVIADLLEQAQAVNGESASASANTTDDETD
ncbi:hypothetical protein JCM10207_003925 [Rhodosporidiobolus poonsookiae]